MKYAILASFALLPLFGMAQNSPQSPPAQPAAAKGDVDTVDHIVAAIYDSISGPAGQERNWDRFKSLFTADAQLAAVFPRDNGDVDEREFPMSQFIEMSGPLLKRDGFYERESHRKSERFGHIANLFSTYESRFHLNEKPFQRGINSIQLYNDGTRWWVRSIIWETETGKVKLPAEYGG